MTVQNYLDNLNRHFSAGNATEHTYRGDLQTLLQNIAPDVLVTNEPARIKCGAPDYVITKDQIPIGYIEAKDLGADLKSKTYKPQFDRYRASLSNLIFTDYLDFHLYIDGTFTTAVKIAEIQGGRIVPLPGNFNAFTSLLQDFCTRRGQTIRSSKKLAEMMAGKARMLAIVIEKAINSDEEKKENSTLKQQMNAFKDILIHDITPKAFADIYAQTIAYGMFAARLHDDTPEDFSRQEAAALIPKTNPFLRKLFQYISGYDIDSRIEWIVAALADIFRATDVRALLQNFGKATQTQDPVIHFYETFLAEYDPKLRKSRGVWYTPQPVVNFIVRAVDDLLKTEFGLSQGLADTAKTKITVKVPTHDKRFARGQRDFEQEVHKVQILDPATGTGTFLAEVVKQIYKKFEGQQGIWRGYVENHLIPRLNGFELLMASYAMAHLKLDLLLRETGYNSQTDQRLKIYLTNSLEEHHPDTGTLFASWLSAEANEANEIKRDTPVMCVIGNPPYSGISINKGQWITDLIEDYKYIDGEHFKERKHWLNDDYVKFIRYGQHFIEKNGEGILAFINNHSFIDNPTFRGMRWHLLNTFDTIYIIDLHGNSLKKEVCPDGSPDKNVFDIMPGVSINIFVKAGQKKKGELARVLHTEFWGSRESKYQKLWDSSLKALNFEEVKYTPPFYFFMPKEEEGRTDYEKGFKIDELMPNNKTGIVTMGDSFIIADSKKELENKLNDFFGNNYSEDELKNKYRLGKNYAKWIIDNKEQIKVKEESFVNIDYRPFDTKWTVFNNKLLWRWRYETMQHFIKGENIGLVVGRQSTDTYWSNVQVTSSMIDNRYHFSAKGTASQFPLYRYPETENQTSLADTPARTPNLNPEIVTQIAKALGLAFTPEKEETQNTFAPIDILDYIYAVLHSPAYRETYKEFLKIDFPRVPYPKDKNTFWQLVALGNQLRQIHLLESPKVSQYITSYPQDGDNRITRTLNKKDWELYDKENQLGRIWINDTQYFDKIPLVAWEFYIGGYQPAQKWLKDRRGRELSYEDIQHYQKIIVALYETYRIMQDIDKIPLE